MAEYTNASIQTVQPNQNALLTDTPVCGGKFVNHRDGSGIITLASVPCGTARYKITAYGNIAIPEGGSVVPIEIALSLNGEPLQTTIAQVTPAAVSQYFNVSTAAVICVPSPCCVQVAVSNPGTVAINISNLNVIAERIA